MILPGRGALEGVDHDQELHDRLVHRPAGGLHQEDVLLSDVLHHADEDVLVRELEHLDLTELGLEVAGDPLGERLIGVAGVDAELVGVHVVLRGAGQARPILPEVGSTR